MSEESRNVEQTIVKTLEAAATSDGFEAMRSSAYDALKRADERLNALIQYWKTGKRPVDPPEAEPFLGPIPFCCTHPDKIPAGVPDSLKTLLKKLVKLGVVPKTTISVGDWGVLEQKVEDHEAVESDGSIYSWGKYEQLDLHWAQTLYNLLTTLHWPTFGKKPHGGKLPGKVAIGILGDWGTGFYDAGHNRRPAKKVIDSLVGKNVDYIIHLGDVYYSGTPTGGTWMPTGGTWMPPDEEQHNLVDCWPNGRLAGTSFTLNSNHEMYGHANGYFHDALKSANFKHQDGTSYFLLENEDWQIFGLDTAWDGKSEDLFMDGTLAGAQVDWIGRMQDPGKKVILMCHHDAMNFEGTERRALWDQAVKALKGRQPDYWYWGHVHNAIVYKDPSGRAATKARCVGHGAIPFGFAWGLTKPESIAHVAPGAFPESHENIDTVEHFAHERVPQTAYVKNGFAVLRLAGKQISEEFYNEDGDLTWRG